MEAQAPVVNSRLDTRHIDVLDGIRALAIALIFWFHLWQQSWLTPYWQTPVWLQSLGLPQVVSFDFLPRSGFLMVDLMLLLSAFCLFLPHARRAVYGDPVPSIGRFYQKRLCRILPPYYLSVLCIFFFVALPSGAYASVNEGATDLISTLTFTQTFFPNVLLGTKLNGVLWTAAVEMQFYLIFPLLAVCFRKRPLITYCTMTAVSLTYLHLFALNNPDSLRVTLNQLPGFFGVFANGMLFAYGYVWLSTRITRKPWLSAMSTAIALVLIYIITCMQKAAPSANPVQVWQAENRYVLSLVFGLFIFFSALAARWYRFLFSNRIMVFFAAISYNVYIWHQWLAVKFKQWRVPFWEGEQPPNFTGDRAWQWQYTLLVIAVTLLLAVILTYLFERPLNKRLLAVSWNQPSPRKRAMRAISEWDDPSKSPPPNEWARGPMDESPLDDPSDLPFPGKQIPGSQGPAFGGNNHNESSIIIETNQHERNRNMHYTFNPRGVCSTEISFDLNDGKLFNVRFTDGCNGNLKAISKLVEGRDAQEVVSLLSGNTCGMNRTSCADQLARAIGEALAK